MRSGTSYFNGTIFKKTICRYWPVWAAYFVIWLVALPLNALMLLQLDAARQAMPDADRYIVSFARHTPSDMVTASLGLAVVFGVLAAMAVCSHLYNARSANFFGSLPVRREGLFLTHYLAGLAFLIVPNVVIFLLTLLIEAIGGAVFLPGLGFWLAVSCGECLFFYSMGVFCGMFTGHILALPAFYGIFNALACGVYFLMETVCRQFYYGFDGFEPWTYSVMLWLTPAWKLDRGVQGYVSWITEDSAGETGLLGLDIVAVYAVVALVLAVCAFFLYRVRHLERAGDVVSVKCMRPVFAYGVSVCAGLALGMLTASILGGGEPALMVSIVVWAVIGYFVARMLLEKSFRVFGKWKGAAAVTAVFIALFCVVGFDLTGFETRIPTADQVDYLELNGFRSVRLNDGGDYVTTEVSNPALVEYVLQLHRAAVNQKDSDMAATGSSTNLRVTYHLKNGRQISRLYDNIWIDAREVDQEGTAAWAMQQMYNDRDLYWRGYGFADTERRLNEEGCRLQEAMYQNGDYGDGTLYYGGADARELYEAVKEDFRAGRIGVRRVQDWNRVYNWHNLNFTIVGEGSAQWTIDIRVQDTATSTLAVLERLEGRQTRPETE